MAAKYRTYFRTWYSWKCFEDDRDELTGHYERKNGVYAFRLKHDFGRFLGKSSILYFGMCNQNTDRERSGLYWRVRNYWGRLKGTTYQQLRDIEGYFGKAEIEYSLRVCEDPQKTECELLQSYYSEHLELPPMNAQQGMKSSSTASDSGEK